MTVAVVAIGQEAISRAARQAAEIHLAAYSHGHFTSTFGLPKLTEYNAGLISHSDICLGALEGEKMLGFLISGENVSRGVAEFVRNNRWFLIRKLLSHPQFLFEKISFSVRARLVRTKPSKATYRLLSIAIDPRAQSSGIGGMLLAVLEEHLRARGVKRYGLSVLSKNPRAIAFYRRNGFELEKIELGSAYFSKDLQPAT